MKAAIVEAPNVLRIREIPEPEIADYDVLCQLLFGATCTGTDQHLIGEQFPWPVHYPTILGHESIGRVVQVGAKVRNFAPGDLVTRVGTTAPPDSGLDVNWGGFTEFGIARDHWAMREDGLPEGEWAPYRINQKLPAGADPAAATMMITWRETYSYAKNMGIGPGSRVMVVGSGGNGLAFVAHARNLGAADIAMVGSGDREEAARACGATRYFNYRDDSAESVVAQIDPEGVHFLIDAVGKSGALDTYLPAVASGGLASIYGLDDFGSWSLNVSRARGTFTYYVGGYDEASVHEEVTAMMLDGRLDAGLWLNLDSPFPLEDIGDAFDAVRERRLIKALVRLSG